MSEMLDEFMCKGGSNDIDNLQVLCHKCNLAKHDRMDLKVTREKLGGL